jgi:polyhydroxybutyrate depolymerase
MKKFTLFFLTLFSCLSSFAEGEIVIRSFMHGDSLRKYVLYVPADYDGTEDWPLVISLHGYTGTAELQMMYTNMNAVADTGHFFVAYPQGLLMNCTVPGLPLQGFGWNSSEEGDTNYYSVGNADDVDFILQVINQIEDEYRVAPERVFVTGFSGGAFMCYKLACELDDKIAAIAPVGGTPRIDRACSPERSVPVLHIHGTEDPMVNYGGFPPLVISVEENIAFWVGKNGCDNEPVITRYPDVNTDDSSTVERYQWNNCEAEFVHLKVIGGGHQIPGGVDLFPAYFGHMNLDISGSGEIWNFFKRNPHPDIVSEGEIASGSIDFDGSQRDYSIYLPKNYQSDMPVVFNLHGYNQSRQNLMDYTMMNSFADTAGFIVVYPVGTGLKWNSGASDGRSLPNTDDVGFISALIDTLDARYNFDMDRIYCTGFSNGAEMTYRLAAELGNRIAAIATVCGGLNNSVSNWTQIYQVPVLDINGTDDPYRNWGFDWWSAERTFDFWNQNNECSIPADTVLFPDISNDDSCMVEKIYSSDCSSNSSNIRYRIINGGHQWPGANIAFHTWNGGNLNMDINANVEMWNFFKNYENKSTFTTPTSTLFVKGSINTDLTVYPNPVLDQITIEFEVENVNTARLLLVNSLGQLVANATRELLSAGPQKLEWQLQENLPNGLYFLVINLDKEKVLTKSVMLITE